MSYQPTTYEDYAENKFYEFVHVALGAILISILITAFVIKAFTVDGPSMMPTIQTGERLLVDRLTYRLRSPQRGEVVVFRCPADPSQFYIKRVIGLPGDTVVIRVGRVYVNDVSLDEPYTDSDVLGSFGPSVVPAGHLFVLGDNRNNSEDSRDQRIGFVAYRLVMGRAMWRYWPLTRVGSLESPGLAKASS